MECCKNVGMESCLPALYHARFRACRQAGNDGLLQAGEGDDDRTFTAFRTPNRNTSPRGESYQGSEKISSLSSYFHSYFSGYATLINESEFQGSFRGDRERDWLVKREAHALILEKVIGAEAEKRS